MEKINFQNNITKCNADTFNTMQDNIEDAIPTIDSAVSTSSTNGIENQAITNYINSFFEVENWTSKVSFSESVGGDCQFYKVGNFVLMYYQGENTTHTQGTVLYTIPVGYRPVHSMVVPCTGWGNNFGQVNINSETGIVNINSVYSTSNSSRLVFFVAYTIGS